MTKEQREKFEKQIAQEKRIEELECMSEEDIFRKGKELIEWERY